MQNVQQPNADLSQDIRRLTALAAHSEARLQALERRRRWLPPLSAGALMLAFTLGHFSGGPPLAWGDTQPSLLERSEHAVAERTKAGIEDVMGLEAKGQRRFHEVMESVRQDVNEAKDKGFEPGIAIAVILHDMKRMLEAVPRMADDMHRMTGDMHEMNQKMSAVPAMAAEMNMMNRQMGVMSHGVDSTMGRMGRMIPWAP